jgi:hypothetical protein
MKNQLYLPFRVSYLDKSNNKYRFIVNAGDVNSFILNTYKGNFSNTSFNKENYNPVNEFNKPTFEYQKKWDATFTTDQSCDVYLTIPKIPIGFDSNLITTPEKYKGPDWWNGEPPSDFINQFKIVTSNEQGFQDDYDNNTLYIEKDTVYNNLKGTVFPEDSLYPGKIYIKIATITIQNDKVNIKRYLNSNIISPTKYLRIGALSARNIQVIYSLVSDYYGEFIITSGVGSFKLRSGITAALIDQGGGYYNDPSLFFSTISEIKESVGIKIEESINFINKNYFYGAFYTEGGVSDSTWGKKIKKNSIVLYQVVLIYKENLGGKITINRIINNKAAAQGLLDSIVGSNSDIQKEISTEFEGKEYAISINSIGGGAGVSIINKSDIPDTLSRKKILELMSIKEELIIDEKSTKLNVDDLFEFIGFGNEPVEGD